MRGKPLKGTHSCTPPYSLVAIEVGLLYYDHGNNYIDDAAVYSEDIKY